MTTDESHEPPESTDESDRPDALAADGSQDESDGEPTSPVAVVHTGRGSRTGGRFLAQRVLIGALSLVLGIAIVAQVRQTQGDELASMRQDDLVRLLDEISVRNGQVDEEIQGLETDLSALRSGADSERLNQERFRDQAILAGALPVEGTGILLTVDDPDGTLRANHLLHVMEELRNSQAEAIEISGVRVVVSTYFIDGTDGIIVDGTELTPPYEWRAIGNPDTISGALSIPGGALSRLRTNGGVVELEKRDLVQVTAITSLPSPQYAGAVESESESS